MRHIRTAIPIVLLIGSMKLVDYHAEFAAVRPCSRKAPMQTLIDCEEVQLVEPEKPFLFSLIPYSLQQVDTNDAVQTSVDVHALEQNTIAALDQILDKVKKLYLLKRLILASLSMREHDCTRKNNTVENQTAQVQFFDDCIC